MKTVKVKLKVCRTSVHFSQNAGDMVNVSPAEAGRMVEAGQAVIETAALKTGTREIKKVRKVRKVRKV